MEAKTLTTDLAEPIQLTLDTSKSLLNCVNLSPQRLRSGLAKIQRAMKIARLKALNLRDMYLVETHNFEPQMAIFVVKEVLDDVLELTASLMGAKILKVVLQVDKADLCVRSDMNRI